MKKIAIGVIAVAAMVCFSSVFIVDEGQKGIVVQFGKVKRVDSGEPRLYEPGLHFKVPLIDQVRKMDARIQTPKAVRIASLRPRRKTSSSTPT